MGSPDFPPSHSTMNLLAELFAEYIDSLNRAGFIKHLFLVVAYSFLFAGLILLLIAAVVWPIWCLHNWWHSRGDRVAVEELSVPAVAGVVVPRVGDAGSAQVDGLRRRMVCG